MSRIIDEHREYLSDTARLDAFRRAAGEAIRPGDVVLDLASGTGILGLFACQAGARLVYSIEVSGLTEVARALAVRNGFGDRVVFIQDLSTLAELPECVDVVVTDQIGHFGFEAGLWEYLVDARTRFLKPGGRFIPSAISLVAAPIEAPETFARIEFWDQQPAGFDFSPVREWAVNSGYPWHIHPDAPLAAPAPVVKVCAARMSREPLVAMQRFTVERNGILHGIGGWFEAQLSSSARLTNAPGAADRINRRNAFLPIERPVPVSAGDVVDLTLHIDPMETMLSWGVTVTPLEGAPARFSHSTLRGMLLAPEDLRRTRPDYRPALSPRGLARRTVLELCDGDRRLADIEREVFDRHASLFGSAADASVFVAEVVTRYSR